MTKQETRVLDIIRENGFIERASAFKGGIANLTAVISRLRDLGEPIGSRRVDAVNQFGAKTHYTEYYLAGGDAYAENVG